MSEGRSDKPDPIEDVRKGLGLLLRAAKGAVERLPKGRVEELVVTGAKEVGRAFENVAATLEKQVLHRDQAPTPKADEPPKPPETESAGASGEPAATGGEPPPARGARTSGVSGDDGGSAST